MAIDGHFGLCRKKSAGKSVRPPLHVGVYFEPQEKIDEFVSTYKDGFALSDGETCERLWSFMRRFSRMTKEM